MFTKQMHLPLNHFPNPISFFVTAEKTLLHVCWWVHGKVCNLTIETVQSLEYTLRTGGQSLGLFPLWLHPFTSLPTVYEGPFSPALVFSIVAILAVVRWNLSVILVCPPPAEGDEHFLKFICCLYSVSQGLSVYFICSFTDWLICLGGTWFFAYSLNSLDINPISCLNGKDFSPSSLFPLLCRRLGMTNFLNGSVAVSNKSS